MKNSRKVSVVLILVMACLIGVVVSLTTISLINMEFKLKTPTSATFFINGEKKFLQTSPVSGAEKFIFSIDGVELESSSYVLDVTTFFTSNTVYEVKVMAIASKEKNNSDFSQTFKIQSKEVLLTPILSFDQTSKTFSWTNVGNNATYELIVNGVSIKTEKTKHTLTNFVGEFSAKVIALPFSSDDAFWQSEPSATLSGIATTKLETPSNISINSQKVLFFNSVENADSYLIYVNGKKLENIVVSQFDGACFVDVSVFEQGIITEIKVIAQNKQNSSFIESDEGVI